MSGTVEALNIDNDTLEKFILTEDRPAFMAGLIQGSQMQKFFGFLDGFMLTPEKFTWAEEPKNWEAIFYQLKHYYTFKDANAEEAQWKEAFEFFLKKWYKRNGPSWNFPKGAEANQNSAIREVDRTEKIAKLNYVEESVRDMPTEDLGTAGIDELVILRDGQQIDTEDIGLPALRPEGMTDSDLKKISMVEYLAQ